MSMWDEMVAKMHEEERKFAKMTREEWQAEMREKQRAIFDAQGFAATRAAINDLQTVLSNAKVYGNLPAAEKAAIDAYQDELKALSDEVYTCLIKVQKAARIATMETEF